ncbi:MAG: GIY-YIG nuclease family protein [Patescibacteria group bacterium]|jgi:predicted GIY-YIG superfamily endonuclease
MYYVYVLLSHKDRTRYIGYSSKEPHIRLAEHNSSKGMFTRGHQPWILTYYEEFEQIKTARERELF